MIDTLLGVPSATNRAMDSAPTTASGSSNGTAPYGSHQSNSAERFQHTGPPSSRTADSQSERSSTSTATRKCVACHNSIWMGNAISFLSFHVHQNCFRCQLCSASLRVLNFTSFPSPSPFTVLCKYCSNSLDRTITSYTILSRENEKT